MRAVLKSLSNSIQLCLAIVLLLCTSSAGAAGSFEADLLRLGASDRTELGKAIEMLAARGDARALPVLEALRDGTLRFDSAGKPYLRAPDGTLRDPLSGALATPSGALRTLTLDNRLRRALLPAIGSLSLFAPDPKIRLSAAQELSKRPSDELAPVMRKAHGRESHEQIRELLAIGLAQLDLQSENAALKLAALQTIEKASDVSFKAQLEHMVSKSSDGTFTEKDERVRAAAASALAAIETKVFVVSMIGHLFYGLSLGSVLLLAALGLAVTFGLMRVINMAHGEMLMIGAYTTFSVQNFFQRSLPAHADLYLVAAVPCAFIVSFVVGVILERTVIRFLYGRPLETLLATWGISLLLIQTVRLIYGAQNVTVANPSRLSGGFELLPNIVITYSRLVVIGFSIVVVTFVWLLMQKTSLGLQVRAVTQNREMASAMGIATRRVDMMTFGFGSGIAGLGGVAISQLGNVGPELGQGYIVDSFMVVVLGGVGKLAGAIAGALGLGVASKFLEPTAGAVLAKICILGFVILFIQKRPQGMFALKGRAAELT